MEEENKNLFDFLQENRKLLQDYAELRIEIFRLQVVRTTSKISGLIIWLIISIFLLFLILIFGGITLGFWLSSILNSNVAGFGLTTLIMLLIVILLAIFRKQLFINPVIRVLIQQYAHEDE